MTYLPIGLRVEGAACLVVGGGSIGTRKAQTLLRAGARVTVVAPDVTGELARLADQGRLRWEAEAFRERHLDGVLLAVIATDDAALNGEIGETATRCGALVCDASSSERSQVIFGALLEEGDTTIAVFTGGRNPPLARSMRDRIATLLEDEGDT
ncbi:MAG: bifunctional precorrin-2 dehydrogenase/sirohydrochlorin ferrochelatase [Gemmatimonadetes bacterium]|nr:bifunctional precorrin-2 dehydrogenase/sirohydrochlorin ferrochelatase [Gemmatimonadota bacterium]